jgi:hypothetical protein
MTLDSWILKGVGDLCKTLVEKEAYNLSEVQLGSLVHKPFFE